MIISAATYVEVYIPRSGGYANELTLHSEVTNKDYKFNFQEIPDCKDYHHMFLDLSDVPEGEYVYSIGEDKGVVRVGDYKADEKTYKHKETHKEYNIYG